MIAFIWSIVCMVIVLWLLRPRPDRFPAHIWVESGVRGHINLFCRHCSSASIIPVPAPANNVAASKRAFRLMHGLCEPKTRPLVVTEVMGHE